jgi:hypothetical protein
MVANIEPFGRVLADGWSLVDCNGVACNAQPADQQEPGVGLERRDWLGHSLEEDGRYRQMYKVYLYLGGLARPGEGYLAYQDATGNSCESTVYLINHCVHLDCVSQCADRYGRCGTVFAYQGQAAMTGLATHDIEEEEAPS